MKKTIITIGAVMLFTLVDVTFIGCGNSVEKYATTEKDGEEYACPMHPEIVGKAGDTCSECGMDLEKK